MRGGALPGGFWCQIILSSAPLVQAHVKNQAQLGSSLFEICRALPEGKQTIRILFVSTRGIVGNSDAHCFCAQLLSWEKGQELERFS